MERLTKPDWKSLFSWECCGQTDFCLRGRDKEKECVNCIVPKLYARVAMFEDAGVPMQKTIWMKEVIEEAFDNDTSRIERAHELHVADKEGRVVVLPCKVGDTVWIVGAVRKLYSAKVRTFFYGHTSAVRGDDDDGQIHMIRTTECDIPMQNFGKTVFLSREEAERALEEMEGKKDGNETSM